MSVSIRCAKSFIASDYLVQPLLSLPRCTIGQLIEGKARIRSMLNGTYIIFAAEKE